MEIIVVSSTTVEHCVCSFIETITSRWLVYVYTIKIPKYSYKYRACYLVLTYSSTAVVWKFRQSRTHSGKMTVDLIVSPKYQNWSLCVINASASTDTLNSEKLDMFAQRSP